MSFWITVPKVTGTGGCGPASGASFLHEERRATARTSNAGVAPMCGRESFTQKGLAEAPHDDQSSLNNCLFFNHKASAIRSSPYSISQRAQANSHNLPGHLRAPVIPRIGRVNPRNQNAAHNYFSRVPEKKLRKLCKNDTPINAPLEHLVARGELGNLGAL